MARTHDWSDHAIVARGREAMHAPWGAYADRSGAEKSLDSPWVLSLDGDWAFLLVPRPEAAPADFMTPGFVDDGWARLHVPGNWELQGHGEALYVNIAYPFAADPPAPPADNPTGCYRRSFVVPPAWRGRRIFLELGSVDSSFHLWINGVERGYGSDSKLPSSFEITENLHDGENTVAIRVYRWGTSAYLEKQDYWHLSGIQRSVRIIAKPTAHLRDWCVQTYLDDSRHSARVVARAWISRPAGAAAILPSGMIDYPAVQGWMVVFRFRGLHGEVCAELKAPVARRSPMYGAVAAGQLREEAFSAVVSLEVSAPLLWSPETPHLYTLVLELQDPQGSAVDWERQPIGIRQVDIRDGVMRLNGQRLVVRGVNRHEFHPCRGRTLTLADMREDIIAIKRLNFNAVRTCHYPDDERWYDLCDELGLAVVDEANLETHGLEALLSRDPTWCAAYLERAIRMVLRDRNHACVLLWSSGNESSFGPHHAAMASWMREADPTRPVQYESGFPPPAVSDILAPMYPDLDWVRDVLADPAEQRPMIMCEYAYAKGNALGNFDKFWDLVWRVPRFQGGFVWDWRDKALEIPLAGGGVRWEYGRKAFELDHVERMCLNGVVGPDLKEHPGAWEIKFQQAPVHAWASEDDLRRGHIRVQNRYSWLSLDHLTVTWAVTEDGRLVTGGELPAPSCAPMADAILTIPFPTPILAPAREYWLILRFRLARDELWAPRGHELQATQFQLPWRGPAAPIRSAASMPALSILEDGQRVSLKTERGGVSFDRVQGVVVSLTAGSIELLSRPMTGCFVRAPTDIDHAIGDAGLAAQWKNAGLGRLRNTVEQFSLQHVGDKHVHVHVVSTLYAEDAAASIRRETTYIVFGSGDLIIDEGVSLDAPIVSFARVGLRAGLFGSFGRLRWYGRGPFENYPDRKAAALVGDYSANVSDLLTPYVYPQENGLRCDVRWVALTSEDDIGLLVRGMPVFCMSALPVWLEDLEAATNLADLSVRDEISLHCDGFHMGVGGDTGWTINVHPEYRLPPGHYRYALRLRPLLADDDPTVVGSERLQIEVAGQVG